MSTMPAEPDPQSHRGAVDGITCGGEEPATGNYFVATYPPFSCWTQDALSELRDRLLQPAASPPPPGSSFGMYVHIPFCADRCAYCYYRSYDSLSRGCLADYLENLSRELGMYAESPLLQGRPLDFLYFGGGTPSLLAAEEIERLAESLQVRVSWEQVREVTFECAPKTVSQRKLLSLRRAGVTRLSLGIQQLDDHILQLNGRIHLTRDVLRAYELIREAGFPIVNVDLIVGLLGETDPSFFNSLERVIALRPDSVTIYQLELPRNTPLYREQQAGRLPAELASWEVKRRRLGEAFAQLEQAGYTIATAYAAWLDPGRHPFVYQQAQYRGADLLGLGCSSFSYLDGIHLQNRSSLDKYSEAIAAGQFPWSRAFVLDEDARMVREFVLQLKLGQVGPAYFREKFGIDVLARFAEPLAVQQRAGHLSFDRERIALTREGLLRADQLLSQYYLPEHRTASYW